MHSSENKGYRVGDVTFNTLFFSLSGSVCLWALFSYEEFNLTTFDFKITAKVRTYADVCTAVEVLLMCVFVCVCMHEG